MLTVSLLMTAAAYGPAGAQAQKSPTSTPVDSTADAHTPRGALWRAAAVPGWGQIYNGQYLKIPIVYGALGGITALAITFNRHYLDYRHAYLYQAYQALVEQGEIDEHPFPQYEDDHQALIDRTGPLSTQVLRDQRNKLRRNRDLMYIGLGIAYGLSVVDAYVSAHLADFDVGEDLSLQLAPVGREIRLRLTFN